MKFSHISAAEPEIIRTLTARAAAVLRITLLPAASLVIGMGAALVLIRVAGRTAAVDIVLLGNSDLFAAIGWTYLLLGPMAVWWVGLLILLCLRRCGFTRARCQIGPQAKVIEELAPRIGLIGTFAGIAEVLRSNSDVALFVANLPAVGNLLYSTIAGLVLSVFAFPLARFESWRRGGPASAVVMVGVLAVSAPAVAAADDAVSQRNSRESIRRLIHHIAVREGVDPLFVEALARSESDLEPLAVSPNGCCVGIMQLHHRTARAMGVRDRTDPVENVTAGTRYFRQLTIRFGSVAAGLIAYNAGPTVAQQWVTGPGVPLPSETMLFVERVVRTYRKLSRISPRR